MLLLLLGYVVTLLFSFVMIVIDHFIEPLPWPERQTKAAWDLCVLALGLQGGILAQSGATRSQMSLGIAIGSLPFILLLGLLVGIIRKEQAEEHYARAALYLAGVALAVALVTLLYFR